MELDWEKIVAGLSGIGTGILLVYNRVLAARAKMANTQSEIAQADGDRAIADASRTVFELVSQRLQTVEGELTSVRQELAKVREQLRERDNKIHYLEMHIVDLEHTMRQHGIEPPPMRYKTYAQPTSSS